MELHAATTIPSAYFDVAADACSSDLHSVAWYGCFQERKIPSSLVLLMFESMPFAALLLAAYITALGDHASGMMKISY
jgi:hypothetical protein